MYNARAHADMIYIPPYGVLNTYNYRYNTPLAVILSHPWTSTVGLVHDRIMKVAKFQFVKNKAPSKRL